MSSRLRRRPSRYDAHPQGDRSVRKRGGSNLPPCQAWKGHYSKWCRARGAQRECVMKKFEIRLSTAVLMFVTAANAEDAKELVYESLARDAEDGIRIVSVVEVSK